MKITLDTNCVINLLDNASTTATSADELAGLIKFAMSGSAEIAITTRVESDLLKDKNPERQAGMLRQLQIFPVVGSVARFDVSTWDSGDVWVTEKSERLVDDLTKLVFPGLSASDKRYGNKLNDIDHLVGHFINRRDIFVTDDRDILRNAKALKSSPGIVVMKPIECLDVLTRIEDSKRQKTLTPATSDAKYHSPALSGSVTFDYSNNNHSFSLGNGYFLFETRWSKASDTSIHAYNDPPSISGIAIAKGAEAIADIRDASAFDFSSRSRTPTTGQILIWRNANGLYAATKIIAIQDDTRGASSDKLTIEYVILGVGGHDFGANA